MDDLKALIDVEVPDIGDFSLIPVVEILVSAGDIVAEGAPLVTLESDKSTLDIPSPVAGVIREVKVAIGSKISAGAILLSVEAELPNSKAVSKDEMQQPESGRLALAPKSISLEAPNIESADGPTKLSAGSRSAVHASPSIRRLARELGVDLRLVRGSGPRGRIVKSDVNNFVEAALSIPLGQAVPVGSDAVRVAPWPQVDYSRFGEVERVERSSIQKIAGSYLSRNSIVIPHVTNFDRADITDLDAFRRTLNSEKLLDGLQITILSFLIKAVAATLERFAIFNSSLDGEELVFKKYCNIGFAVDTPNGLLVPVLKNAREKGISAITKEVSVLAQQARIGKIRAPDMQGGSFTISSLGGIGGTGFTPIINAPEVAILGVSRATIQPVWNEHEFIPRLIMPLSLSWDHRVVDGVAAASFLVYLSKLLSDFRRVVL